VAYVYDRVTAFFEGNDMFFHRFGHAGFGGLGLLLIAAVVVLIVVLVSKNGKEKS
jgi:hypothetical protein